MKNNYYFLAIYLLLILVAFLLPSFTISGYSITEHTLSQLGAQQTHNNWVMNLIFIMLSCITIVIGCKILNGFYLQLLLLLLFSISLFMSAICLDTPIDQNLNYDDFHSELHSIFSIATKISLIVYCISVSFIVKRRIHIIITILMSSIILMLTYLMFTNPEKKGIYDRAIFISAFGWLFYSFKFYTFIKPRKSILKL
ncbi:DUF998 domain-containing protein [Aquimarina sp. 2201CG5-10]|uniref:DUF998 domain-containing protein n=1 Tax=Aquimarina callyspongiae TaxID=3098150 RepID=UPI002AB4C729|nr:DUF998 domain-containing protein [Aquimarina sp. 2201CG5-10]MDY8134944.1 DUF998 domain-containing protein [Aquimarina sp. 2201CG5-10]